MISEEYKKAYRAAIAANEKGRWQSACENYKLAGKLLLEEAKKVPPQDADPIIEAVKRLLELAKEMEEKANAAPALAVKRTGSAASAGTSGGASGTGKTAASTTTDEKSPFSPVAERPNVHFEDIAGLESAKQVIRDEIIGPYLHPDLYKRFNRNTNGGILMYGLPGTGKTMLGRCIATETNADFFSVRCSEIMDKYVGESEKHISALFNAARESGNAIIMFDEFEAIGKKRGGEASNTDRVVTELLTQMDGFEKNQGRLIVIAATNLPWMIDSALTRPKRLTHHIYVPLPDATARRYLLTRRFSGLPCSGELDFDRMVIATEGFNGADLDNLVEQACNPAIRRGSESNDYNQYITQADVDYALKHVHSSVRPEDIRRMNEYLSSREIAKA